jgi:Right handed beta helix region
MKKMKICRNGLKFLMGALCSLLLPVAAHANNAVVDCSGATPGAFTSITAALATLPKAGPNSITVSGGPCSDNVLVRGFSDLAIQSAGPSVTINPANPNRRLLNIFDSRNIFVGGPLVFNGGLGIVVNQNSVAQFDGITIQNSTLQGIRSVNSIVDVSNSSITNSTRPGISATGGSMSVDGGVTITGGAASGITMLTGHLILIGGDGTPGTENVISNNAGNGVGVSSTAEADISGDNRIDNNKHNGVQVIHTSSLFMSGGEILNNLGVGVHVGETSHGEFDTVKVQGNGSSVTTNNLDFGSGEAGGMEVVENSDLFIDGAMDVSNNSSNGIFADESSVLSSLGGNTVNNNAGDGFLIEDLSIAHFFAKDTATGNGRFSLQCDDTSLVEGDTSTLTHVRCGRIHARGRGQHGNQH